jgi:hypothetical protein
MTYTNHGEINQQANQQSCQQTNNKQTTTNKNDKNIYSILYKEISEKFPKDKEGRHQSPYDYFKAIRMARKDSRWEQLTPEEQDKLLKEI